MCCLLSRSFYVLDVKLHLLALKMQDSSVYLLIKSY